jgi:hypothetical protein
MNQTSRIFNCALRGGVLIASESPFPASPQNQTTILRTIVIASDDEAVSVESHRIKASLATNTDFGVRTQKCKVEIRPGFVMIIAFVAFAVLFAEIGMARRNSLRYRAEMVASANARTLPPDLNGNFIWRYHPDGTWDTKLSLTDDGTFTAAQE